MNGALLRYLARRYALGCAACALAPVFVGLLLGVVWPEWKLQLQVAEKFGVMKVVQSFLRSDLVPSDSAAAFFQIAFMHPLTLLSLIVAMAMPTVALPASARGRGTLDLLLATPLTRRELVVTTFLFTVPFTLLHASAPMLGTWVGGTISSVADQLPFSRFVRVSVESTALALFFSGLSLFLSVRAQDAGGAIRWLAIVVFYSLFLELVGTYWHDLERLKWFTPFGWFEPPQVLAGTRPFVRDSAVLGGAGVLLAALAVAWEERRASA